MYNNQNGINWVVSKKNEIQKRQDNKITTVIILLCSIIGIKRTALGIAATALSVSTATNAAFLEECEDRYTKIYVQMTSRTRKVISATITETYKGVFVKHAKATMWVAQVPTYTYRKY